MTVERPPLRYLAQDAPWPAYSGAALRDVGLISQLARFYRIELTILTRGDVAAVEAAVPAGLVERLTVLPAADRTPAGRLALLPLMLLRQLPYHSALTRQSLRPTPLPAQLAAPQVPVFTGSGAWGSLAPPDARHWILNQTDADIAFWRVYAAQSRSPLRRAAAQINGGLAARHFPPLYRRVGRIISVSAADRALTLPYAGGVPVDVIPNGVDCRAFAPQCRRQPGAAPLLLFSGTSAARNVAALEDFLTACWPRIRAVRPTAQLLVAGDWSAAARQRFVGTAGLSFSGRLPDLRPLFQQADLAIAPFTHSHGSKLKIAEAFAAALPVVATEAALHGLAVEGGVHALAAADVAGLADACLALLADPQRARAIGRAGRQFAEAELDWPLLGQRLQALVEAVRDRDPADSAA
jgi:glycosyltransferase involved in cell wall biosynthesis